MQQNGIKKTLAVSQRANKKRKLKKENKVK